MRDLSLVAGPMSVTAFLSLLVPAYGLTTAAHGRGYVEKLRGVPTFIDGWLDGLRDGLLAWTVLERPGCRHHDCRAGCHPRRGAARRCPRPAARADGDDVRGRNRVGRRRDHRRRSRRDVRPALARLRTALHDEVLPHSRPHDRPGVCHMPGGEEAYQSLLHAATSTDLTAAQVHELGQRAVGAPRRRVPTARRDRARRQRASRGPRPPRDDPLLRYGTPAEVLDDATAALDRARAEAPRWFTRLPQAECEAVATEGSFMAFYTAPSPDGARGGTCFFNVSDPAMWTRFSLEPTTFHESIPGHHLQLALAQELDLHPVLGELEVASYEEGWGLYAERLADEMSLYSSPLQRLGMLTLDSLRATRLVVDTGLHAMGWTRDEAINVMLERTSLVRANVEGEVDRYIADPGQATSYMIGRLEIERLRAAAQARLGHRFSLPAFHDAVLGNGMTPLPELARTVGTWTERNLRDAR